MSVVVLGMDMPDTCEECRISIEVGSDMHCPLFTGDSLRDFGRKAECGFECRPDWCPLCPLPEKHGRLIDADDYAAEIKKRQDNAMLWKEKAARNNDMTIFARGDQAMRTFSEAKLTLDNMETIVEAEGD